MSLSKEELRKEVGNEFCEALRYTERAANLLRHAKENYYAEEKMQNAIKTAEALERIVANTSELIDIFLSR